MIADDEIVFVDSNVFLYALDSKNPDKAEIATAILEKLWSTGAGRLSWQVIHEVYDNAVGKMRQPPAAIRERIQLMALWRPDDWSIELTRLAWHWMDHAQLTYWDALIVAAAENCGATLLLSEDFQDGRHFGSCRVKNPFTAPPPR